MARMRRKRCEECEDLFEFVPIGEVEVAVGWRQRVAGGGLVLLKGVVLGIAVGLLIPFLSFRVSKILNLDIYSSPYLTGIVLLLVGVMEMLVFDHIQRAANDYLDWKQRSATPATKKPLRCPSLPPLPGYPKCPRESTERT